MPDKHLVLDPDVHESLKSKKRRRGATLREIGNSILRTALDRPELSHAVARVLILSGKITSAEYEQARLDALTQLEGFHTPVGDHLQPTDRGTLLSGSWEISSAGSRISNEYHILEAWARDGDQHPLPLHYHEVSEEFIVVVEGRLMITYEESQEVFGKGEMAKIPRGRPHAVTPLTDDTQVVVVCMPPDPTILLAASPRPEASPPA